MRDLQSELTELGLSCETFAERAGCNRSSVWRWVTGKRRVPRWTFALIDEWRRNAAVEAALRTPAGIGVAAQSTQPAKNPLDLSVAIGDNAGR